jgi:hypothetical protein
MEEVAQLLVVLVQLYATIGIMAIGFGMMVGGPDTATAVGTFFFVRPVQAALAWSRSALVALAVTVWTAVIGRLSGWITSEIKEVAKDIRWLVTRERGWVRHR